MFAEEHRSQSSDHSESVTQIRKRRVSDNIPRCRDRHRPRCRVGVTLAGRSRIITVHETGRTASPSSYNRPNLGSCQGGALRRGVSRPAVPRRRSALLLLSSFRFLLFQLRLITKQHTYVITESNRNNPFAAVPASAASPCTPLGQLTILFTKEKPAGLLITSWWDSRFTPQLSRTPQLARTHPAAG